MSYTLQNIIDFNIGDWIKSEALCTNCTSGSFVEKTEITRASNTLILVLKLYEYKNNKSEKINNLRIKQVPTTVLTIKNYKYRVISTVFHVGNNTHSGHYLYMYFTSDKSKWISADDNTIQMTSWSV